MESRLAILEEVGDFRVAEGEPNPEGWDVVVAEGIVIGKVDQLIVDTVAMKVRYLDCEVAEQRLGLDPQDRHLLIPIGYARLDEERKHVVVDAISADEIANMPMYRGLPLERADEEELHSAFTGGQGGRARGAGGEYGQPMEG